MKKTKMPRDANQRAKATLDLLTGERQPDPEPVKNPAAVESGRRGGQIGGAARAAKLTPEQRSASAQKAAEARWRKP
jgi:hypothetical protein